MTEQVENARALKSWARNGGRAPLQFPLGRLASSGAVARTLGQMDDKHVRIAYDLTVGARDGIHPDREAAAQDRDGLELGRRALSYVMARRGLRSPERIAADAVPLTSKRGRALPDHLRLDPGARIQSEGAEGYAEVLSDQRRGFFDRLFNRPLGIAQVDVIDGDSVRLNGKNEARLHGIDAPELPGEAGQAARKHLRELANTGPLSVQEHGTDHYGRHLVTLYAGEENLNRRMVQDGYARAYGRYSKRYWPAQAGAALARRGLWRDGWLKHPEGARRAGGDAR